MSEEVGTIEPVTIDEIQLSLLGGQFLPLVSVCENSATAETAVATEDTPEDSALDEEPASEEAVAAEAGSSETETSITATDLPNDSTATLYIDTSGSPDLDRFIMESELIAQRKTEEAGLEYPLPADLMFYILEGNDDGLYEIDPSLGSVNLKAPPNEDSTEYEEERVDTAGISTLIEDLANACPDLSAAPPGAEELGFTPEIVGYSTWEEVRNDPETWAIVVEEIAAAETEAEPEEPEPTNETSEEIAELVQPTAELAAQNPEVATAIEAIRTNPVSAHSLTIGIMVRSNTEGQLVVEDLDPSGAVTPVTSADVAAMEMWNKPYNELTEDERAALGISVSPTIGTTVVHSPVTTEFLQSISYVFGINVDDGTVQPETQLPVATTPPPPTCIPQFVGAAGVYPPGGSRSSTTS